MRVPLLVFLLILACNSPSDPQSGPPTVTGRLSGLVTIGPFCPPPTNCPTPPSAYTERKVLVHDESGARLLHTVDIDLRGLYVIDLPPARYKIDIRKAGMDSTPDLPVVVTIQGNQVTRLDIRIDTGIR